MYPGPQRTPSWEIPNYKPYIVGIDRLLCPRIPIEHNKYHGSTRTLGVHVHFSLDNADLRDLEVQQLYQKGEEEVHQVPILPEMVQGWAPTIVINGVKYFHL